jgi:hypothetical protein
MSAKNFSNVSMQNSRTDFDKNSYKIQSSGSRQSQNPQSLFKSFSVGALNTNESFDKIKEMMFGKRL